MKKILNEFKNFAVKGNMLDMAVGMIIGGAFTTIVNSVVQDLFMPVISLFVGKIEFSNLFLALDGNKYATLDQAKEATAVFAYGSFITQLINFLILALVVFLVVKALNAAAHEMELLEKKGKPEEAPAPTTKVCPYCLSEIAIGASRCPHCTSEQPTAQETAEAEAAAAKA